MTIVSLHIGFPSIVTVISSIIYLLYVDVQAERTLAMGGTTYYIHNEKNKTFLCMTQEYKQHHPNKHSLRYLFLSFFSYEMESGRAYFLENFKKFDPALWVKKRLDLAVGKRIFVLQPRVFED